MALALLKPGCLDRSCCRNTIDGLQVSRIILLKDQPAGFESGNFGLTIVSDPASLQVMLWPNETDVDGPDLPRLRQCKP